MSALPESVRRAEANRLAREEAQRPFNLSQGPLLRATLVRLAPEEYFFLLNMHHIVSDGWSMGIFTKEIAQLYAAFARGESSPLAELPVQYADFAVWQREWLDGKVLEQEIDYWKQQLDGAPALLELPTDRPRPAVQTHRGARERRERRRRPRAVRAAEPVRRGVSGAAGGYPAEPAEVHQPADLLRAGAAALSPDLILAAAVPSVAAVQAVAEPVAPGATGRFTFTRMGNGRFTVSKAEYIPTLVTRYQPVDSAQSFPALEQRVQRVHELADLVIRQGVHTERLGVVSGEP